LKQENRSVNLESEPFEGLCEIVKKRYRLFTWQDRKIELNSKRELLYYKLQDKTWVIKETFNRTDISQINFDGKEKEKIQMRMKNKIYLFKFSSP
jgi:hypothetical protein